MRRALGVMMLAGLSFACHSPDAASTEAGVGGDRTGCEQPGTHSVKLSEHSCACEDGYTWCSAALDDFDCCAIAGSESDTGEPPDGPSLPCDEAQAEQLACVPGSAVEDPSDSTIWACNGERWVEAPGYATFACMAEGFGFAYGCRPGEPEPEFLCGHGQGSPCDMLDYGGACSDEDIIDTCIWGRRTVDRCSRLCTELEVFGPGFSGGACSQPDPEMPAVCECCVGC